MGKPKGRQCGTGQVLDPSTPDGVQVQRFTTFLRLLQDAPVDDQGCRLVSPRLMAYAQGDDVDPVDCTGLAASWCPRHGSCVCPKPEELADGMAHSLDSAECPLHDPDSDHPWPQEVPS